MNTILRTLNTSVEEGLSKREAKKRSLNESLAWIRSTTGILYTVLPFLFSISLFIVVGRNSIDLLVLTSAILLYGIFSYILLKKHQRKDTVQVCRSGKNITLPISSVVPGDIIEIQPGEDVPMLLRLVEGSVHVDESHILGPTHESIRKDASLNTKEAYLLEGSKLRTKTPIKTIVLSSPNHTPSSWWNSKGILLLHLCWYIALLLIVPNDVFTTTYMIAVSTLLPNLIILLLGHSIPQKNIHDRHILPLRTLLQYDYKNATLAVGQTTYPHGHTDEPVASFIDTISLGAHLAQHSTLLHHLEKLQVHFPSIHTPTPSSIAQAHLLAYDSNNNLLNGTIQFRTDDDRIFSIGEPFEVLDQANYLWDGNDPFGKRSFKEHNLKHYAEHLIHLRNNHLIVALSYQETAIRGSKTITSTVYVGHLIIPFNVSAEQLSNVASQRSPSSAIGLYSTLPSYQLPEVSGAKIFYEPMDYISYSEQPLPLLVKSSLHQVSQFFETKLPSLKLHTSHTPLEDFNMTSDRALKSHVLLYIASSYLASLFILSVSSLLVYYDSFAYIIHGVHVTLLLFVYAFPMGGVSMMKQTHSFRRKILLSLIGGTLSYILLYGLIVLLQPYYNSSISLLRLLPFTILLGSLSGYIIHILKRSTSPIIHIISLVCIILCVSIPLYYKLLTTFPLLVQTFILTLLSLYALTMLLLSGKKEVGPNQVFPFRY